MTTSSITESYLTQTIYSKLTTMRIRRRWATFVDTSNFKQSATYDSFGIKTFNIISIHHSHAICWNRILYNSMVFTSNVSSASRSVFTSDNPHSHITAYKGLLHLPTDACLSSTPPLWRDDPLQLPLKRYRHWFSHTQIDGPITVARLPPKKIQ